ncbi:unnamed protein product [Prorocentrum cordatum]|uniref:Uncharacterized protein n=2 Tax=Prorocentrum cordatum TaxID=2364126 RepID=A0ABN9VFL3_9DINO|nr:unnamed protein product [Polarella glacialis]
MSRTWSREGMTCVGTDRVLCTTIVSWQELSGSVQKLAHFGHPDSSLRRGHPPARHVKARALGSIRMARASSPVEFSEARRRMPGTADGADPLTTTEALFYDSDADTDDEFQARLAEAYRECSPSRQRRLAERSKNPSSFASYAMQNKGSSLVSIFPTPVGGPVDVNGCEHARAPVFPSVVQPPVFPNEAAVPFSVPAPPFAVPNLSQRSCASTEADMAGGAATRRCNGVCANSLRARSREKCSPPERVTRAWDPRGRLLLLLLPL